MGRRVGCCVAERKWVGGEWFCFIGTLTLERGKMVCIGMLGRCSGLSDGKVECLWLFVLYGGGGVIEACMRVVVFLRKTW